LPPHIPCLWSVAIAQAGHCSLTGHAAGLPSVTPQSEVAVTLDSALLFPTEPIVNLGAERRGYLRDPDSYLIEVGQPKTVTTAG
jgi:hypothetical protein